MAKGSAPRNNGESGASMVEYAILLALIALVVALAAGPLGTRLTAFFNTVTF